MEIHHKIKPPKNWREFLKEYGIIVLGVLTALGAEQAVEAIHHRSEIHEAREALNGEMGHNLTSLQQTLDQRPCALARLAEVERWRTSMQQGRPLQLKAPISLPPVIIFSSAIWKVTTADAVSRMPLEERSTYAKLYTGVENNDRLRTILSDDWIDLGTYQRARKLSDDQLRQIDKDIDSIRGLYEVLEINQNFWLGEARKLGIAPKSEPRDEWFSRHASQVCKPLLAS